jgi:hypothetical protein
MRLAAILKVIVYDKGAWRQFGATFTTKLVVLGIFVSTLWTDHQCSFFQNVSLRFSKLHSEANKKNQDSRWSELLIFVLDCCFCPEAFS